MEFRRLILYACYRACHAIAGQLAKQPDRPLRRRWAAKRIRQPGHNVLWRLGLLPERFSTARRNIQMGVADAGKKHWYGRAANRDDAFEGLLPNATIHVRKCSDQALRGCFRSDPLSAQAAALRMKYG